MLHRLIQILVLLPIAVLLIVLSVANRHPVTISLDPFVRETPALAFSAPLFAVIFGALLIGILIGGIAAWLSQGKWRQQARRSRAEAARWRYRAGEAAREGEAAGGLPAVRRTS